MIVGGHRLDPDHGRLLADRVVCFSCSWRRLLFQDQQQVKVDRTLDSGSELSCLASVMSLVFQLCLDGGPIEMAKCHQLLHGPQLLINSTKSANPMVPSLSKSAEHSAWHGPQKVNSAIKSSKPTSPLLFKSARHTLRKSTQKIRWSELDESSP